jgi:hypothetical protein
MKMPERTFGVTAARQWPDLRWNVTIENEATAAIDRDP